MAASITFQIVDRATTDLRALRLMAPRINPRVGAAVSRLVQDHLFARDSRGNKSGFPSQHFYSSAAKGTTWTADAAGATISINKQGFRLRLQGGTIKPVNVKLLTIPARAEAYGKRAGEFGNLVVKFGKRKDGSIGPCALVAGAGGATKKKFAGRNDSAAERPVQGAEEGVVMYWLVKEAIMQPDPTVLPTEQQISDVVKTTIHKTVETLIRRGNSQ